MNVIHLNRSILALPECLFLLPYWKVNLTASLKFFSLLYLHWTEQVPHCCWRPLACCHYHRPQWDRSDRGDALFCLPDTAHTDQNVQFQSHLTRPPKQTQEMFAASRTCLVANCNWKPIWLCWGNEQALYAGIKLRGQQRRSRAGPEKVSFSAEHDSRNNKEMWHLLCRQLEISWF